MRLHKNLTEAVIEGLGFIFNDAFYADKVVEKLLKKDKRWGARDRAFIAETTYEIVRWKRLYAEIANVKEPFSKSDLFQIFIVWATLKNIEIPHWLPPKTFSENHIKENFEKLSKIRKYREAIPDWLDEMGEKAFGSDFWEKEIHALNQIAPVVIRANSLKISTSNLKEKLQEEGISTHFIEEYPEALELDERTNIFTTKAFSEGLLEVQDASSQRVAPFLEVKSGMRVIDTCAGAGGKTLHLASLMKNKGQIIAMDIFENKLLELKKRAKRNEVFNVETRIIDNKQLKRMQNTADRVLIDAPCSGLGVLKRNPDAKWKLKPDFLEKIIQTQQEILQNYSKLVKKDGKLVYATCSIFPDENKNQVEKFLNSEQGKKFVFEEENAIFAHTSGYDGFYMARLKKISN